MQCVNRPQYYLSSKKSKNKTPSWRSMYCICVSVVLSLICRVRTPLFPLLWPLQPGMLILFHTVSSSLWTGNGWSARIHKQRGADRKWSHCSTCNQEREQPRQAGDEQAANICTGTYINVCVSHRQPVTSPPAVGTGATTQETSVSKETCTQNSIIVPHTHTEGFTFPWLVKPSLNSPISSKDVKNLSPCWGTGNIMNWTGTCPSSLCTGYYVCVKWEWE